MANDDTLTKLAAADEALRKAVAYVEATSPVVDEYEALKDRMSKRAHAVVGNLVGRGLVPKTKEAAMIDKLMGDPAYALEVVEFLADKVQPAAMGKRAEDVRLESGTKMDPFEYLVRTGNVLGHQRGNSGSID